MLKNSSTRGFTFVELLGSIGVISLSMSLCLPNISVEEMMAEEKANSALLVRFFRTPYTGEEVALVNERVVSSLRDTPFDICQMYVEENDPTTLRIGLWTPEALSVESNLDALKAALATDEVVLLEHR